MIGKIALGSGIFGAATYLLKEHMEYAVKNEIYPDVDMDKIGTISIHLGTLNEENFIYDTLESLTKQQLYQENRDKIELVLVDSYSDDNTVEIAKPYVDRVLLVSRGRLTARREAIEQTDADIIVGVDAGDYYPPNFLHFLLRWFEDPEVVAVTGSELPVATAPIFIKATQLWSNVLWFRLQGRGMAMRRDAFFGCGGWDESIDQTSVTVLQQEEEFALYNKLSRIGKVIKEYNAVVYGSSRRFECTIPTEEIAAYCYMIDQKMRF